jgi:hypothetical protein
MDTEISISVAYVCTEIPLNPSAHWELSLILIVISLYGNVSDTTEEYFFAHKSGNSELWPWKHKINYLPL